MSVITGEALESRAPTVYAVKWCNVWQWSAASHSDTGSLIHLSSSSSVAGMTLCGRAYPKAKGYPAGVRYCKRCIKKAYAAGHVQGFTRGLEFIRSVEE